MASFGRITTSAVSIPTELTVAAAAFNIDFSLLKVEAPAAFHGVRDALSPRRRDDAEGGLPHMTARRLGALFDAHVPEIPNLIEAYGTRVSEICSTLDNNAKPPDAGIFRAQAGPDGTTIWAGATSGSAALAVHLLACLLARIWKSHEAISLWAELVERRKQEIQSKFTGGSPTELTAMMAAQQIITRDHLAAWDASARAWLRSADSAKKLRQTQLMLIINNLSLAVNSSKDPYESVIQAWISSLKAMERLVQGMPQRVQDGAVLLAISSWHLYPDMEILVEQVKRVDQQDALMHGGLITLSKPAISPNKEGVFWSLPLSRMRYYHPPQTTERRVASDTSRVTMNEFWLVILGAMIGAWVEDESGIISACKFLLIVEPHIMCLENDTPWLKTLCRAASRYLDAEGMEKHQATKLFNLGVRRGHGFLSSDILALQQRFPFLDLLAMIDEDERSFPGADSKNRISVLRAIAQDLDCSAEDLVIKYPIPWAANAPGPAYAFASAGPENRVTPKRTYDSNVKAAKGHTRWTVTSICKPAGICDYQDCECEYESGRDCCCKLEGLKCTEYCHRLSTPCDNFSSLATFPCEKRDSRPLNTPCRILYDRRQSNVKGSDRLSFLLGQSTSGSTFEGSLQIHCPGCFDKQFSEYVQSEGEVCQHILPDDFSAAGLSEFSLRKPGHAKPVAFKVLLGDVRSVALFRRIEPQTRQQRSPDPVEGQSTAYFSQKISGSEAPDKLYKVVSHPKFNMKKLRSYLSDWEKTSSALRALQFVTRVYEQLDGATINLEILGSSLSESQWAIALHSRKSLLPKPVISKWDLYYDFGHENQGGVEADTVFIPTNVGSGSQESLISTLEDERQESFIHTPESGSDRLALVFACLAMFDSGHYDIDPVSLLGVFALSSGDSVYVASGILTDPAKRSQTQPCVRRVFGNLGRTGMSFLISPAEPRLNAHNLEDWQLINHCRFDSEFQNSFTGTSLHLSYTDYEMPINLGVHGLRDKQAVLVEAIITIDDQGSPRGELEIVPLISPSSYKILDRCVHTDAERRQSANDGQLSDRLRGLVSIDCWDELLEFPDRKGIFRATGSWEARMAGLLASLQLKKSVVVLPEKPCLMCLVRLLKSQWDVVIA